MMGVTGTLLPGGQSQGAMPRAAPPARPPCPSSSGTCEYRTLGRDDGVRTEELPGRTHVTWGFSRMVPDGGQQQSPQIQDPRVSRSWAMPQEMPHTRALPHTAIVTRGADVPYACWEGPIRGPHPHGALGPHASSFPRPLEGEPQSHPVCHTPLTSLSPPPCPPAAHGGPAFPNQGLCTCCPLCPGGPSPDLHKAPPTNRLLTGHLLLQVLSDTLAEAGLSPAQFYPPRHTSLPTAPRTTWCHQECSSHSRAPAWRTVKPGGGAGVQLPPELSKPGVPPRRVLLLQVCTGGHSVPGAGT